MIIKKIKKKIKFIESKRSQQIEIGLKQFNMTNKELRNAILSLDDNVCFPLHSLHFYLKDTTSQ